MFDEKFVTEDGRTEQLRYYIGCDLGIGHHTSKVITMIHNSLNYVRRTDLEIPYIARIVCDIKLTSLFSLYIYWQWSLPRDVNVLEQSFYDPIFRYSKFIEMCEKIIKTGRDTIIVGDDNIDSYNNYNIYSNYRDSELKDIRDNFMIQ